MRMFYGGTCHSANVKFSPNRAVIKDFTIDRHAFLGFQQIQLTVPGNAGGRSKKYSVLMSRRFRRGGMFSFCVFGKKECDRAGPCRPFQFLLSRNASGHVTGPASVQPMQVFHRKTVAVIHSYTMSGPRPTGLPVQLPPRGVTIGFVAPIHRVEGEGVDLYMTNAGNFEVFQAQTVDQDDEPASHDPGLNSLRLLRFNVGEGQLLYNRNRDYPAIQRALYFVISSTGQLLFTFKCHGREAHLHPPIWLRAADFWTMPFMRLYWTHSRNGRENNRRLQDAMRRGQISTTPLMQANPYSRLQR